MTKQASEIMKLNFMTDQGSNRDTIRWAWRAEGPPLSFLLPLAGLGTCCGRGTRAVAACQADGRSTRVVSASDGADGADGAAGPADGAGPADPAEPADPTAPADPREPDKPEAPVAAAAAT